MTAAPGIEQCQGVAPAQTKAKRHPPHQRGSSPPRRTTSIPPGHPSAPATSSVIGNRPWQASSPQAIATTQPDGTWAAWWLCLRCSQALLHCRRLFGNPCRGPRSLNIEFVIGPDQSHGGRTGQHTESTLGWHMRIPGLATIRMRHQGTDKMPTPSWSWPISTGSSSNACQAPFQHECLINLAHPPPKLAMY